MKNISVATRFLIMACSAFLISCGGGGSGGGNGEVPVEQKNPPAKTVGTLPANGEPCSDYEEDLSDESKVLISFKWNTAQYAQNYRLIVSEGSAEVHRNTYSVLQAQVQLDRGKTYTWSLTSINEDGETQGDTYSFTTPGTPVGNFAPYAAEISMAFDTNTMEMSVSWIGNDEDGDSLTYDVTVWEGESIVVEELDYTTLSIDPVIFKSGENYTIEIISRDTSGNFSISEISELAPE